MGQKILSLLNASLQDKSKYRIRVFTFRFNATSKVGFSFLHFIFDWKERVASKNTLLTLYIAKQKTKTNKQKTRVSGLCWRSFFFNFMKRSLFVYSNYIIIKKVLLQPCNILMRWILFCKIIITYQWNIKRQTIPFFT